MDGINVKIIFVRSNSVSKGPSYDRPAATLSRNGHEVIYLGWDRDNVCSKTEYNGLYKIHRFQMKAPHSSFALILYLSFWWLYEFYYLMRNSEDIIHACDFDTLLPAIIVKILKNKKLCYTIYDFYADNLPAKTPYILRQLVAFMEIFFIQFTDITFLVSSERKNQIAGAKVKNLEFIYNTPDDIYPHTQIHLSHNTFLIFYAGELSSLRGLKLLCKIVSEFDDVKLVLAGSEIAESDLNNMIENSKNIKYVGWINHEKVLKWTLNSDMSFAFYDPEIPNNRYASPNKLFEAMMCAKPIIINSETIAAKIVKECNCGITMSFNDENALRSAIFELKRNPQLRKVLGNNGRKAYEQKYNWKLMERRLLDSYNKIMK
jgi:glycosyltransferase involved in cell wall biosynthesis